MKIQAYLIAAIINLKRLATALYMFMTARSTFRASSLVNRAHWGLKFVATWRLRPIAA